MMRILKWTSSLRESVDEPKSDSTNSPKKHSVPDSNTSGRRDSSSTVNTANEENTRRDSAPVIEMSGSASVPVLPDGSVDYNALYEDPTEPDVETQPSVIKHLISQVKIGMDLTKVVLPTFILERRSLLEMYSDYFAHPDIFLKAVDLPTPQERMVQIVKWYLSSYHAGRKSSVAKKPYNPILGEIFRCWWDVKDDASGCPEEEAENQKEEQNCNTASNNEEMLNKDGPVPWCRKDQLVFLAEQVSHHPPISAFYAEHAKKRVSLCAHIWTKSKFLGLSVGVHNIGQAVVRLLDHKEEYISTFPNGYGRSILTVPWIELGGTTYIKCPQTGYYCNIEFITKPFYGGKRHRIMAEVFSPKEKKPFLTVTGEWNGIMEAKWADGSSEVFIDTRKLNVIKKKVKSVTEQQDNESRKIWKSVTLGLRYNDIDQATHAKMQIEQKQRDEAKTRKEKNEAWEPKFFYEQDGAWIYKNPLEKRLGVKLDSDLSSKP